MGFTRITSLVITCHHRSLTLTLFINTPLVINNRIQPKTWPFQDLEFNKVMESKTWSQVLSFKTWQQWNLPSFGRNLFSMPRGHGSLATSSTAWLCEEKPISQEAGNLSALFQRLPFCVVRTNLYQVWRTNSIKQPVYSVSPEDKERLERRIATGSWNASRLHDARVSS